MSDLHDVMVCGSGPAGMIAALGAHAAGLSTVLIGAPASMDDKRTTALLGPSLDHLAALGLGQEMADIGVPLMTMRLIDGSRRLIRAASVSFEAHEIDRSFFGLNCPNVLLNQVLHSAVASSGIERHAFKVADYRLDGSNPAVTLSNGAQLSARAILAADGRHSPARQAAGVSVRRWSYPQTAAVGVVAHSRPHENISTELHTETGPFTFVPMPGQRSSFVCALAPEVAARLGAMTLQEAGAFLEARSLHVLGNLSLEAPVQAWPLEGLVASAFAARGVFLIGEAAHAFPPIGAQGLNLSVRDGQSAVEVVAGALKAGEVLGSAAVAARFTAGRRADVWARTYGVDALNRSLLSNNPLVHIGRAMAIGAAQISPGIKRSLMAAGLEPFGLRSMLGGLSGAVKRG